MRNIPRQPPEIRLFHWLFFAVISVKIWSGFYISFPHPWLGFPNLYCARMAHSTMTPVLAALLVFRFYYALLSRDWRELLFWKRDDLGELRCWLRYFLFLERNTPLQGKYSPVQRLLFTVWLITMPLFYATGAVMLNLPYFRWLNVFFGSQGIARVVHYLISVLLLATVAFHVYLALTVHAGKLLAMFSGRLPARERSGEEGGEGR
jgi:Ni/Fe-hydrogenase 1 B-type cytochrome subunit